MKQNIILITAIITAFSIGFTFSHFQKTKINKNQNDNSNTQVIAILQPVTHPALEQIKKGFKDQLEKQLKCSISFKEYNGNGNQTLMRAQAEEALNLNPALIFTIATTPALLIKELTIRKNKLIPLVCGAAAQEKVMPKGENITHITGTDDMIVQEEQLQMLKFLKPEAANILLVYDGNTPGLEKSIAGIEEQSKKFALNIIKVPLYAINEINQKTAPFINQVDTILVLKDNLVVSGLDSLVKLCNQKGITLMASDLDSVDRGAALAFGVSEYQIGVESALQATAILDDYKQPKDIPFKLVTNSKIKVNAQTAKKQGLILNDEYLFMLGHGEVFEGEK